MYARRAGDSIRGSTECVGITYPLAEWVAVGPALLRQRSLEPVSVRSGARSWQVSRHPGAVLLLPARASPPDIGQRVLYGEAAMRRQGGAGIFVRGGYEHRHAPGDDQLRLSRAADSTGRLILRRWG